MAANITKGQRNWSDNFNDLNKEVENNTDDGWVSTGITYQNGASGELKYKLTKIGNLRFMYVSGQAGFVAMKSNEDIQMYTLPKPTGLTDWTKATIVAGRMVVGWAGDAASFWQSISSTGAVTVSNWSNYEYTKLGGQQINMIIQY